MSEVTQLLSRIRQGHGEALSELFALVYPELRSIARRRLSRDNGGTHLNTTALVHECYLKFAGAEQLAPGDRAHFFAYVASAMRSIIVDAARARLADRRGAGQRPVTLDSALIDAQPSGEEQVMFVHEALADLSALDPRLAHVVELRYFGGMTDEEVAEVLGVSSKTVRRDWEKARLVLASSLRS